MTINIKSAMGGKCQDRRTSLYTRARGPKVQRKLECMKDLDGFLNGING